MFSTAKNCVGMWMFETVADFALGVVNCVFLMSVLCASVWAGKGEERGLSPQIKILQQRA